MSLFDRMYDIFYTMTIFYTILTVLGLVVAN